MGVTFKLSGEVDNFEIQRLHSGFCLVLKFHHCDLQLLVLRIGPESIITYLDHVDLALFVYSKRSDCELLELPLPVSIDTQTLHGLTHAQETPLFVIMGPSPPGAEELLVQLRVSEANAHRVHTDIEVLVFFEISPFKE